MEGTLSAIEVITGKLSPARVITGTLSSNATHITGKITGAASLTGILTEINTQIAGALIIPVQRNEDIDTYDGEYIITPKPFDNQVLPTADFIMRHNVQVKKIPYYQTSNTDGYTVYIGGE